VVIWRSGATISWGTSNTGFGGQKLILGAPTATHTVEFQNPLNMSTSSRTVQVTMAQPPSML
jgi:hypothetical protein